MGFKYLDGKNWKDISREERFFCAELFFTVKGNEKEFVKFLKEITGIESLSENGKWEIAYEVCFYRDFFKKLKTNNVSKTKYSQKRTFDLCLFSEEQIIIIEGKAFEGFDTKQLNCFKEDERFIKEILNNYNIEIILLSLYSSLYSPKESTKRYFNGVFTWKDIYDKYFKNNIFLNADNCYRK